MKKISFTNFYEIAIYKAYSSVAYVHLTRLVIFSFLLLGASLYSNSQTPIDLYRPVGVTEGVTGSNGIGAATYIIPIDIPAGVKDIQPNVTVSYSSQGAGNGFTGHGWSLSPVSMITRAGKNNFHDGVNTPITYTSSNDAFVIDGQRLMLISGTNGANGAVYGTEQEGFSQIEAMGGNGNSPDWFKVTQKNGTILEYGTDNSKLLTNDGTQIIFWALRKVTDPSGNYMLYNYNIDNANRFYYLSSINYTGNAGAGVSPTYQILFTYSNKTDYQSSPVYISGSSVYSAKILDKIDIRKSDNTQIRSYTLAYQYRHKKYFLTSVTESGANGTALNPITFSYGENASASDIAISGGLGGQTFTNQNTVGDFNGDGRQDILTFGYRQYTDNNNSETYFREYAIRDFNGSSVTPLYHYDISSDIPNTNVKVIGKEPGQNPYAVMDFDNDGKDDVVLAKFNGLQFNGININYTRVNSSVSYKKVSYDNLPVSQGITHNIIDNGRSYFIPGDFDGDGFVDYIIISRYYSSSNSYKAFLSTPAKNVYNQEISNFGVGIDGGSGLYAAYKISEAKTIIPINFDGDGITELLVVRNEGSYVVKVFPTAVSSGYYYSSEVLHSIPDIKKDSRIYPGDFNGDGNTDLLVRSWSRYDPWKIFTSDGKVFTVTNFTFNQLVTLHNDLTTYSNFLAVGDYDGDGKTDIWHSGDMDDGLCHHFIYYSNGTSFTVENFNTSPTQNTQWPAPVGDFNGDGKLDFLKINTESQGANGITFWTRYIMPKPFKEQNLLTSISNLGHLTNFDYGLLNGKDNSAIYIRTEGQYSPSDQSQPTPHIPDYVVPAPPMYVVSNIRRPNGIGSQSNEKYYYQDLIIHSSGRGLLGFKRTDVIDVTGYRNTSSNKVSLDYSMLYPDVTQKTFEDYTGAFSRSIHNISFQQVSGSSGSNRRFFLKSDRVLTIDDLSKQGTEVSNTYDDYGNITQSISKAGPCGIGNINLLSVIETSTVNSNYATYAGAPYPAFLTSVTTTKVRAGQPAVGTTTNYTYTAQGLFETTTDNAGTSIATTVTNTYNGLGLPVQVETLASQESLPQNISIYNRVSGLTEYKAANSITFMDGFTTEAGANFTASIGTSSGPAVLLPIVNYVYDPTGRFVLEKKITGSGITKKTTTTYDDRWGVPLTETSTDGLITSYVYNTFGELTQTNFPDGNAVGITKSWETGGNARMSTVTQRTDGSIPIKVYADILGREIKTEKRGFNNDWITTSKTYNELGQLESETAPHYTNETINTTNHLYDGYGRPKITTNTTGSVSTTYIANITNGFTITTTNAVGQTSSKTADGSGKIISSSDNGHIMNFAYDSWGNQLMASSGGKTFVTNTYDSYGRRIAQADINAGNISYEYNSIGQLVKQTDANGNVQTTTYDIFGRTATTTGTQGTTTYTYYNDPVSGKSNDNITQIVGFNGDVRQYQYDALHRVSSESITAAGTSLTKSYTYDNRGNLAITTYPAGFLIRNVYDNNDIITQIRYEQGTTVKTLFTATAMNSRGLYTAYNTGNGKSKQVTWDYNKEMATKYYTAGVQDLNLVYESNTMNLLSRMDAIKGLTEQFAYDKDDRLISARVNGTQQFNMTYDSDGQGKIIQKSDLGNYNYDPAKIHALQYLTPVSGGIDPTTVFSGGQKNITYTSFLKTAVISYNGYQQSYSYGYDEQRITSELKYNGTTVETKSYWGEIEGLVKNGNTYEIYYIAAGNSLNNIIVKQNGSINIYYTYTDQLGSIVAVTDELGATVAEQNFDAWGRKRNPANWAYGGMPAVPDWLYRGFTGHEHMDGIALINMNARIYDPATGQMLAPDNYNPNPYSPLGYNGYNYANGNPLKFVDPDGNHPIVVAAIIGAGIGAVSYTASVALSPGGFNNWNWGALAKSVGLGALSGAATAGIGSAFSGSSLVAMQAGIGKFGATMLQGYVHGLSQGAISVIGGGDYLTGFASGALGSLGASAFGAIAGDFAESSIGQIGFGALAGGIGAKASGGEFWRGAIVGGMVAGLNHVMHQITEGKLFSKNKQEEAYRYMWRYGSKGGRVIESFAYLTEDGVIVLPNDNNGPMTSDPLRLPLRKNDKGEFTHISYRGKWRAILGSVHTHPVYGPPGMRTFSGEDMHFYYNHMKVNTKNYAMSLVETYQYNFSTPSNPTNIGSTTNVLKGKILLY